jgi:hypothetical protein
MKNIFLILFKASGILGLLIFTGCVKNNIPPPGQNTHTLYRKTPNFGGFIFETNTTKYGVVTGIVLPLEAEPKVYVIGNTTVELSLDDGGAINKNEVPAGEYSIYIQPANPNYLDYTIDGVVVNSNCETNIGNVVLQYYGYGGSGGCEIGWGRIKSGK